MPLPHPHPPPCLVEQTNPYINNNGVTWFDAVVLYFCRKFNIKIMSRENYPDESFYKSIENMILPDLEIFTEALGKEPKINRKKIDAYRTK